MVIDAEEKRSEIAFRKSFKLDPAPSNLKDMAENELHELRKAITQGMDSLLNKAETEKRDFSNDETIAFNFADAEWSRINGEISERTNPRTKLHTPNSGDNNITVDRRSYRGMFPHVTVSDDGFKGFRELLQVVNSGKYEPRLAALEARTQQIKDGVTGGYAVPSQLAEILMDESLLSEIVRPRCRVFPMTTKTLPIPAFDGADHSSNLFGGFSGQWIGESDSYTEQTAKLRKVELNAKKCVIGCRVSRELLNDGPGFKEGIQQALSTALGSYLDEALITGNGVNKPLGILNDPALISISRSVVNQISYTDLRNVYSRLHPAFHKDAVWLVSVDAVPQLMAVTDTNNNLIWQPGFNGMGISQAVPQTLFGKPVIITEKAPASGSKGDIIFASLSQYALGIREDLILQASEHVYWNTDEIGIRVILRADGQGLWNKPLTPMNGSTNTLSWAVTLNA